jgi:hypothetical protein
MKLYLITYSDGHRILWRSLGGLNLNSWPSYKGNVTGITEIEK